MKRRAQIGKLGLLSYWALLPWCLSAQAPDPYSGMWEGNFMEQFKTVILLDQQDNNEYAGKILMFSGDTRIQDDEIKEMAQPALDRIAEAGMGMELNTSGLIKPVGEIYPSFLIVSLAFEREIPICFGSDAHAPEQVGKGFDMALKLAREAGYSQYFRIRRRKKELTPLPETLPVKS